MPGDARRKWHQMTQTNRPTLAAASQDGIAAAKGTSILHALEQTSRRKPVGVADNSFRTRRLPWHWPLVTLGLAGAALWGYSVWSSRAPAASTTVAAARLQVAARPAETLPATPTSGLVAPTAPDRAGAADSMVRADVRSDGSAAATPATLVDAVATTTTTTPEPVGVAAAPEKTTARKTSSKPAAPMPAPKTVSRTARPAAPEAPSKPAQDDLDVLVVAALLGPTRERSVDAAAPVVSQPSIASLIRQCRALKPREASACRRQICEGYWGKAQACPVPAASRKTAQR